MTPPPYSDPQGIVFIDHADAPEWHRVMPFLQFPVIDEPYAENSINGSYAQNSIRAAQEAFQVNITFGHLDKLPKCEVCGRIPNFCCGQSINQAGGKFHHEVATPDPDGFLSHTPENTDERT